MTSRKIDIGYLARIEGESSLFLQMDGDKVLDVKLKVFEPPRFFEAFLRGRRYDEAPDITARICGICPVAYQMSAVHALEKVCEGVLDPSFHALRRLLYCGEWIESHSLHIFMLHAPDFLGYPSAVDMAKDYPDLVKQGLYLKKTGNAIVSVLGGREIHPVNVRLGGFFKIPALEAIRSLLPELEKAQVATSQAIKSLLGFSFPDLEHDYEFVSLRNETEYPMNEGRIRSSKGLDIDVDQFEEVFEEQQAPHSHALQSVIRGRGAYLCGPLARFTLNYDQLPVSCHRMAKLAGIEGGTRNPYKSILVRAIEVLFALDEAARIIRNLTLPPLPFVPVPARAGTGRAATEAPRGLLYHRYTLDNSGVLTDVRIVPPTSQNQLSIENDLRKAVPSRVNDSDDKLQAFCEQTIRNYDPCISCATHFLRIERFPALATGIREDQNEKKEIADRNRK